MTNAIATIRAMQIREMVAAYRGRAARLRQRAARASSSETQMHFVGMAQQFEQLADQLDQEHRSSHRYSETCDSERSNLAPSRPYRPRVVLVDDQRYVLRAVSRLLEPDCDVVACAGDGEDAIRGAVRLRPDVMVVDLIMPGMDGLEVCRRMKEVAPETCVVIITAFDDAHVELRALKAGASAFVAKHSVAGSLNGTIARLVERKCA